MKKTGFFLVLCLLLILAMPVAAAPQVAGKSAVLIDAQSGQILYEVAKDEKLPPASTTKILTAIIAIESGKLDDIVTVGSNPPLVEGTKVYLETGEKVRLRDLVLAALVHSANDAALAIGEYLAGSAQEFAKMMNAKAQAIGALNSNFVNPHGLSEENHYATAYDLALIGRYAMANETLLVPKEAVQLALPQNGNKKIETKVVLAPLQVPIEQGQTVGSLIFSLDGQEISRVELLAQNAVSRHISFTNVMLYLGAGLFLLQVLWRSFLLYKRSRRSRYGYNYPCRGYRSY